MGKIILVMVAFLLGALMLTSMMADAEPKCINSKIITNAINKKHVELIERRNINPNEIELKLKYKSGEVATGKLYKQEQTFCILKSERST